MESFLTGTRVRYNYYMLCQVEIVQNIYACVMFCRFVGVDFDEFSFDLIDFWIRLVCLLTVFILLGFRMNFVSPLFI